MTDFVFIHDSAHGAWCWQAVSAALTQYGHYAAAFDLPAHGADQQARLTVNCAQYVAAMERCICRSQSRRAVLVAHGLAGVIVQELLAHYPEYCQRAIFIAAIVLEPGERAIDAFPADYQQYLRGTAAATADRSVALDFARAKSRWFNDMDEATARRWFRKCVPEPLAPYLATTPHAASALRLPRDYLLCTADGHVSPAQAQRYAATLGCTPHRLDAGHAVMLSQPQQLAAALHALVTTESRY